MEQVGQEPGTQQLGLCRVAERGVQHQEEVDRVEHQDAPPWRCEETCGKGGPTRQAEVRAAASKKRKASSGGNGGGGEDGEGDSNDDSNGDGSESKIDADKFDDINFHMRKFMRCIRSMCCMIGSTQSTKILPTLRGTSF
ncbi:hypothetical protein H4Q26_015414 [Puccinia striiformis f. sp. tritici PST-130]|nr:hypothetical protein H4Q26_015414 [Puccinia striiformis f. sp. tritici PST-130]